MHGHILAEHVMIADAEAGRRALVFQILWGFAQDTASKATVMGADDRQTGEIDVGADDAIRSDLHVLINHDIRTDLHRRIEPGFWMDKGGRMNHGFRVEQRARLPSQTNLWPCHE